MKQKKTPHEIVVLSKGFIEEAKYKINFTYGKDKYSIVYINDEFYRIKKLKDGLMIETEELTNTPIEMKILDYCNWRMKRKRLSNAQAEMLRELRNINTLSQTELALDIGQEQTHVSMVECQKRVLSNDWAKALQHLIALGHYASNDFIDYVLSWTLED